MSATAGHDAPEPQPEYISTGPLADPASILGSSELGEAEIVAASPTPSSTPQGDLPKSTPPKSDSTPGTGLSNETRGRRRVHWPPDDKLYDIRLLSPTRDISETTP